MKTTNKQLYLDLFLNLEKYFETDQYVNMFEGKYRRVCAISYPILFLYTLIPNFIYILSVNLNVFKIFYVPAGFKSMYYSVYYFFFSYSFLIVVFFPYMYAKSILSTSLIKLFYKRMGLQITLYKIITYKTKFEDWKYTSNRQLFHVISHPSSLWCVPIGIMVRSFPALYLA